MKKTFLLICASIIATALYSQHRGSKDSKEKLLDKAHFYLNEEYKNYHLALPYLLDYYKQDSTQFQVNYEIGLCLFNIKSDFSEAEKYFENSKEKYPEGLFYLARINHKNEKFQKSENYYALYSELKEKEVPDTVIKYYRLQNHMANLLYGKNTGIELSILDTTVNSVYADYAPVLPPDESILYFTSRRPGGVGNSTDPYGYYFEDIYVSLNQDGHWTPAENAGYPLNSDLHDACLSVSSDVSAMFFYRTNPELTGGDIWFTEYKEDNWGLEKKVKAEFNKNSASVKTVGITPTNDSTLYYLVTNMPGGYGGTDIYQVRQFGDGSWSRPVNLGPNVNTPYDEDAPFLHINGKDFYFSSRGHANMGDFDIFHCEKINDTAYSAPKNMGYPINSVNGDRFFSILPDDKTAYFSSERKGGYGSTDIYKIEFENIFNDYVLVSGYITADSVEALNSIQITVTKMGSDELIGIYKPNSVTGKYVLLLASNEKVKVHVECEICNGEDVMIQTKHASQEPTIQQNIQLNCKN